MVEGSEGQEGARGPYAVGARRSSFVIRVCPECDSVRLLLPATSTCRCRVCVCVCGRVVVVLRRQRTVSSSDGSGKSHAASESRVPSRHAVRETRRAPSRSAVVAPRTAAADADRNPHPRILAGDHQRVHLRVPLRAARLRGGDCRRCPRNRRRRHRQCRPGAAHRHHRRRPRLRIRHGSANPVLR